MRRALLVLFALLGSARAETGAQVTPEQADALFAWFDQLPLPGLHGTDLVRVWPGGEWKSAEDQWEPDRYLAFLVQDGPTSFQVRAADGEVHSYTKNGVDSGAHGFVGFRKVSPLDEARQFLSQLGASDDQDSVRRRWFSLTFHEFKAQEADFEMEDLAFASWCVKLGDKSLALSLLNAPRTRPYDEGALNERDSLESTLQKAAAAVLRAHAFRAFAEKSMLRPDLLASFQKIVALCPAADLSEEREAIRILERMIRDDAAHPALTEEQFAALSPVARASELVFRLRDECRTGKTTLRDLDATGAWPDNGALRALENLGPGAAFVLIRALNDDTFTRESVGEFDSAPVFRVRDLAFEALKTVSGCSFSFPAKTNDPGPGGRSGQRERYTIANCIAAGGSAFQGFLRESIKARPDETIPFFIEQIRTAADVRDRVTLMRTLWEESDPRCVDFLFHQMVEGPETGDRVAAAYGLRSLHDARAIPAMCAEWEKISATTDQTNWPVIDEDDATLGNPWRLANFLITSNAPEAILFLGEHSASLPAEWRANIVSRLADYSRGETDEKSETPKESTKKAIEDALLGFLTDANAFPLDVTMEARVLGGARVCDFAAAALHELWPKKYEFDRWLSPAGRSRQCLIAANTRAKETGDPLSLLPPELPKKAADPKLERIITDVQIDGPLTHSAMAGLLVNLRGSPLEGNALIAALRAHFSKPESEMHGFALEVARYADVPGVSIQLHSVPGPKIEANESCQADILCSTDAPMSEILRTRRQIGLQSGSEQQSWQPLLRAVEEVAARPPETAFAISIQFNSASRFRAFRPHVIRVLARGKAVLRVNPIFVP